MLLVPEDSTDITCIIGIDPGSSKLGVAIIYFDFTKMEIVSSDAWTLTGVKLMGKDTWLEEVHGERVARIRAMEEELGRIFSRVRPLLITAESPFFNSKFPAAYGVLVEVICSIRRAIINYDRWKELRLLPPSIVKNAVNVGGGKGKEVVRDGVLALSDKLKYNGTTPLQLLDEHSIDALAVAYCRFMSLLEGS
jgi:Holliday junction resolvasome RuvABC endonuclease subunit